MVTRNDDRFPFWQVGKIRPIFYGKDQVCEEADESADYVLYEKHVNSLPLCCYVKVLIMCQLIDDDHLAVLRLFRYTTYDAEHTGIASVCWGHGNSFRC